MAAEKLNGTALDARCSSRFLSLAMMLFFLN